MAPHEAALAFDFDWSDVERGIRMADKLLKPDLVAVLNIAGSHIARRARTDHGYTDRTGALTQSIHSLKARATPHGAEVEILADAPYAAAQEFGAKPHIIRARKAKALRFVVGGQVMFRKQVNHPGNKEQAFLANALDAEMDDATDLISKHAQDAFHEAGFA